MSSHRFPAFVAALCLLPACAGGGTPAPSIEASPETAGARSGADAGGSQPALPRVTDPESGSAAEVSLTVVDPGEEPRRTLRYDFSAAPVEAPIDGTLTTTYGISGDDGSAAPLTTRPPTTVSTPTETTILDVDETGTATVAFAFDRSEIVQDGATAGEDVASLQALLDELAQVQGAYEVDERGFTTVLGVEADPSARTSFGADVSSIAKRVPAFVQPLPAEPVGVGAVWTVTSSIALGSVEVVHTVTVELLDIDGDLLELLFTVDEASLDDPDGPRDPATLGRSRITALSLDGGGNVTTRLDRPLPVGASQGMTIELLLDLLGSDDGSPVQRTIVSDSSLETNG